MMKCCCIDDRYLNAVRGFLQAQWFAMLYIGINPSQPGGRPEGKIPVNVGSWHKMRFGSGQSCKVREFIFAMLRANLT